MAKSLTRNGPGVCRGRSQIHRCSCGVTSACCELSVGAGARAHRGVGGRRRSGELVGRSRGAGVSAACWWCRSRCSAVSARRAAASCRRRGVSAVLGDRRGRCRRSAAGGRSSRLVVLVVSSSRPWCQPRSGAAPVSSARLWQAAKVAAAARIQRVFMSSLLVATGALPARGVVADIRQLRACVPKRMKLRPQVPRIRQPRTRSWITLFEGLQIRPGAPPGPGTGSSAAGFASASTFFTGRP